MVLKVRRKSPKQEFGKRAFVTNGKNDPLPETTLKLLMAEKSGGNAPVEVGVLESTVASENRHFKDPQKVTCISTIFNDFQGLLLLSFGGKYLEVVVSTRIGIFTSIILWEIHGSKQFLSHIFQMQVEIHQLDLYGFFSVPFAGKRRAIQLASLFVVSQNFGTALHLRKLDFLSMAKNYTQIFYSLPPNTNRMPVASLRVSFEIPPKL